MDVLSALGHGGAEVTDAPPLLRSSGAPREVRRKGKRR